MAKRVLRAIAKNLVTSSGLCPYDRSCPYAATACTAPPKELAKRRAKTEEELKGQYSEEVGLSIMGEGKESQWPCADFSALLFVDIDYPEPERGDAEDEDEAEEGFY